ncbi:hypothetical protein BX070DRAFT_219229 [Coemansia spiralis]|nr:hypothetical protein BX070DRAFT_219229 [Coemansia spiralis]
MNFNYLPSEIVVQIFGLVSKNNHDKLRYWKDMQIVMAVCRKWKFLALPLAYHCISIRISSANKSEDQLRNAKEQVKYATVATNMSFLPYKCKRVPRMLELDVRYSSNPLPSLRLIMDILNAKNFVLQRVCELRVLAFPTSKVLNRESDELSLKSAIVEQIADGLVCLVPNINIINCFDLSGDPLVSLFKSAIVRLYGQQVCKIECNSELLPKDTNIFSNNLQSLAIYHTSSGFSPISHIPTQSLRRLVLSGVDEWFYWKSFEDRDHPWCISFPNLESIEIDYVPTRRFSVACSTVSNKELECCFPFQIIAPNLTTIKATLCTFTLSLVSSIDSLKCIKTLVLLGPNNMDINLHNICLNKNVKRLFSRHVYNTHGGIDAAKLANDLSAISESRIVYVH